ncbi:MAG: DegT/DnrJ/EryC1/StrS family aminotransferase [Deltaproteobacteria bacterium]|nr:DegT/DnrJ/EryC1/StrS family aminotransferase [Deltaproteobacteria bacterium]
MPKRIYLSPPHMSGEELRLVEEVFISNWIAPVGPQVDAFEAEFATMVGAMYATAVVSGTAALHLALRLVGVGPGDEVLCSSLTFVASASPILYQGAIPVFIDSDRATWNMDPGLLREELEERARTNKLPKAVVLVHLYGQAADIDPILEACGRYGIPLIEDAAEALGATYKGRAPGTFGRLGIYSFNGNKIITTSGGGMLISNEKELIDKARFWSTQARDSAPHYEHSDLGYNYRMSNVLAAIGRGQLRVLEDRVGAKQRIFMFYKQALGDLPGIEFMPEARFGRATRWLTCLTVNPEKFGVDRDVILAALAADNIEARPVWKPMHLQPLFKGYVCRGGAVAEDLFNRGLCLPSGTSMKTEDLERVVDVVKTLRNKR